MIFNRPEEELLKFDSIRKEANLTKKPTFDDARINHK